MCVLKNKGLPKRGDHAGPRVNTPGRPYTGLYHSHGVQHPPRRHLPGKEPYIPHISIYQSMSPEACVSNVSRSSGLVNMSVGPSPTAAGAYLLPSAFKRRLGERSRCAC